MREVDREDCRWIHRYMALAVGTIDRTSKVPAECAAAPSFHLDQEYKCC